MSTSDQHAHVAGQSSGSSQLTRKQLREVRLTGSTPVVTAEEAEAARLAAEAERVAPRAEPQVDAEEVVASVPIFENASTPAPVLFAEREPVAAAEPVVAEPEPVEAAPELPVAAPESPAAEPQETDPAGSQLTRRQMREQERVRTASVPVITESALAAAAETRAEAEAPAAPEPPVVMAPPTAPSVKAPRPSYPTRRRSSAPTASTEPVADEQDGVDDAEQGVVPVSVSALMRAEEEASRARLAETAWPSADPAAELFSPQVSAAIFPSEPVAVPEPAAKPVLPFGPEQSALWSEPENPAVAPSTDEGTIESLLAEASDPAPVAEPTVNPAFGRRVFTEKPAPAPVASFDALVGDAGGSHHAAPNALIFQQAAAPSLSGPVASTGEILVTGSYDLPAGLGSRGHADGMADGKEVDVVLVDGELAATSSPTPIAASAAIGTIKPAGEIIRPPEPEKGNKLMLALTITAGALAVALVGALIVAITTGAFS